MIHLLILSFPLMASLSDAISYCDPLEFLCTTPCGEEEYDFLAQLSCETRRLYNSLDCVGKNRALELSLCYCDIDCAVEQAAREMYCRQRGEYPNLEGYEERVEDESGQNAYNRRFGY